MATLQIGPKENSGEVEMMAASPNLDAMNLREYLTSRPAK
jgi:hypothetical protein